MTRDIGSLNAAECIAPVVRPHFLFEFEFDGAPLYLHTGLGEFVWDSKTYVGSGDLLSFQIPEETVEIEARGAAFNLGAIPSEVIAIALTAEYSLRPCRVYMGFLDEDGAFIDDPFIVFSGVMDVISIDDNPDNPIATLTAESDLAVLRKVKVRRYTPEGQRAEFPDDKGMDFVPSLQDKEIIW